MAFLSIALCTYNAEQYLSEQLNSIAAQRRLPDEMIICDDGSQDRTPALLEQFAQHSPFPVRLYCNDHNLGSTKNFERAIGLCKGEIIALADQDDVWLPDKLAELETALLESPDVGLVFTDAEVVDHNLRLLNPSLWASLRFTSREQQRMKQGEQVQILLKHQIVTGATMMFHSRFREVVLPISPLWVHDGWIALLIACFARLAPLNQPLIQYRQHSGSQIGAPPKQLAGQVVSARLRKRQLRLRNYEQYRAIRDRLLELGKVSDQESLWERLDEKIEHMYFRATLPDSRLARLPAVIREWGTGRYRRFSSGYLSMAKDIFQEL